MSSLSPKGTNLSHAWHLTHSGSLQSALWAHSLSLRMLQFLAPCQYVNTLLCSPCLYHVCSGLRDGDELYPEELARSLVAANLGDLVHAHLLSLVFLYSSTSPLCLLAVPQPWTALDLHSTVSRQYLEHTACTLGHSEAQLLKSCSCLFHLMHRSSSLYRKQGKWGHPGRATWWCYE